MRKSRERRRRLRRRWRRYETDGAANYLAALVAVVEADEYGAFFR